MLKVFLVEDEYVVREGIKKKIDWQANGYEFCGEAGDGELAFPMIQRLKPDIVITDIKMPFMDGLSLSKLIKKELPWTEIIILTGFEEFEYAKEAISIGVSKYLSKPINGTELLKEVNELADKIAEKKKEQDIRKKYEAEMEENLQQDRKRLFQDIIMGNKSAAELIEDAQALSLDLSSPWYNIVLAKVRFMDKEPGQFSNHMLKIDARLTSILDTDKILIFDRNLEGKALIFKGESLEDLEATQQEYLEKMRQELEKDSRYGYFAGIGIPVNRLRELSTSFENASHAFARQYFTKENTILDSRTLDLLPSGEKDAFDVHNIDTKSMGHGKIRDFLKLGNKEEAIYFVEEFFHGLGSNALKSNLFLQYVVMDAYFCVASFLEEMQIEREALEAFDANSELLQNQTLAKEYVARIIGQGIELREQHASNRYENVVREVTTYIEKNYADEELSLNMLASLVNFSPNHLSMIFSQETGQTFIKYLTDYRMNKAKVLLKGSSKKSSEISAEVGYKDPHYFSYLFKKTQGMTPTQYRGGKSAEGED
ncbi:MAG: response regulator [Lachnospiraceae bacterium]|nr:response regulator [Lachnospiraceae bacterium]